MATPESFAQNELILALSEQTFGIESYSMFLKSSTELEATAEIVLLEGIAVEVSLTSRGFQFKGNEQVYETIDDALSAVSPMYAEAKQRRLMAKLSEVATSR